MSRIYWWFKRAEIRHRIYREAGRLPGAVLLTELRHLGRRNWWAA